MRGRAPILVLGLAHVLCVWLAGCAEPLPQIAWRFSFARQELAGRARFVEAEVLGGGCSGSTLFTTRVTPEAAGAEPDRLKPGRYGFRGRAQDAACGWFAEGCREVVLPRAGAIEVVLSEASSLSLDSRCMADIQDGDLGGAALDAGAQSETHELTEGGPPLSQPPRDDPGPSRDAGARDPDTPAGDVVPTPDAGPGPEADPPAFDPRAPKCRALDQAVVACFDFDESLADVSGHGNDALGPAARFESGLSGEALRVGGTRVAIADDPSLDFATFTIELWLRIDGLANLGDPSDARSVLLDKNGQYLIAFETTGELRAQLHGLGGNGLDFTRSDPQTGLAAGEWTYLVYAYDGTAMFFYKDGVRVDARNVGVTLAQGLGAPLHIGSGSPDVTLGFDGLIDALRISNIARGDALVCAEAGKRLAGGRCL